jgi:hypothetical protein
MVSPAVRVRNATKGNTIITGIAQEGRSFSAWNPAYNTTLTRKKYRASDIIDPAFSSVYGLTADIRSTARDSQPPANWRTHK